MYKWETIETVLQHMTTEIEQLNVSGLDEVRQRGNLKLLQTMKETLKSALDATAAAGTPSETPTASPSPSFATADKSRDVVRQLNLVVTSGAEIVGLDELRKTPDRPQRFTLELEGATAPSVSASYSDEGIELGAVVEARKAVVVLGSDDA